MDLHKTADRPRARWVFVLRWQFPGRTIQTRVFMSRKHLEHKQAAVESLGGVSWAYYAPTASWAELPVGNLSRAHRKYAGERPLGELSLGEVSDDGAEVEEEPLGELSDDDQNDSLGEVSLGELSDPPPRPQTWAEAMRAKLR